MSDPASQQSHQILITIQRVMSDMARGGVGKDQTNSQQGFKYRGIDQVMDALSGSLARHGLIILPHVKTRVATERASRAGGALFHVLLEVDYDFICVADNSRELVGPVYGEAMDSADKATNKAMATAYKYAVTQSFCIPFTGTPDPDADTHDVAGPPAATAAPATKVTPVKETPEKQLPQPSGQKPGFLRPGGDFGYGKKFAETPWNVMTSRDLKWFYNAERTPPHIRERIEMEFAWRAYEASQMDAASNIAMAARDAEPFDDQIP